MRTSSTVSKATCAVATPVLSSTRTSPSSSMPLYAPVTAVPSSSLTVTLAPSGKASRNLRVLGEAGIAVEYLALAESCGRDAGARIVGCDGNQAEQDAHMSAHGDASGTIDARRRGASQEVP